MQENQINKKAPERGQKGDSMASLRRKLTYQWEKERTRTEHESYVLRFDDIQISVFNNHIDYMGVWIMNCSAFSVHQHILEVLTPEDAKKKAIEIIKSKIERVVISFNELK
ncbi:MAG: hypothetical protein GY838_17490 [bacterium]|nr:hypothetical protein [bacterium]